MTPSLLCTIAWTRHERVLLWLLLLLTASTAGTSPVGSNHVKPQCHQSEHTVGQWSRVNAATAITFECPNGSHAISHDKQDYMFHNGSKHKVFEWSGGCSCGGNCSANDWEWQPRNCWLPAWNATHFCDLLGDRLVYLAGDSTMHQSAVSLMEMIREGNPAKDCSAQIFYGLSFYLIFQGHADFKWHNWFMKRRDCGKFVRQEDCEQWPHGVVPDIAVLTAGAHQADLGDMMSIWQGINEDFRTFRENFFWHNFTFIWKTQNPGHISCNNFFEPETNDIYPLGPTTEDKYHYYLFKDFDAYSRNESHKNNIRLMDMAPLYLRPDSHLASAGRPSEKHDCLHYCIPGALNLFSILFQNMLMNGEIPPKKAF